MWAGDTCYTLVIKLLVQVALIIVATKTGLSLGARLLDDYVYVLCLLLLDDYVYVR